MAAEPNATVLDLASDSGSDDGECVGDEQHASIAPPESPPRKAEAFVVADEADNEEALQARLAAKRAAMERKRESFLRKREARRVRREAKAAAKAEAAAASAKAAAAASRRSG